ncbi:M20/M25/M40 family metallo-hydrolase [Pirellula sp. SH-Sr6A]|uniref:M20/M25/M40 family metallo-hydrolase n=1 Tax=Pirellula sp. SH-Sr6A TaxID=1632865 RepID=UPI0014389122|nr:M20/M25/M40 family metallo-hydrolase [Pirellula sp. SH-Sr6A]
MTPKRQLHQTVYCWAISLFVTQIALCQEPAATETTPPAASEVDESKFLTKTRQLTLDGLRSGEGYFSQDGRWMVFQSEREKENPFYQIYLMDRETGDVERVSPGFGKTTCAWIHPDGERVLFASTQFDPNSLQKQKDELEFRASGQTRRYSWDYDPAFELVEWNRKTGAYKQLTDATGYDAEASYSPDGSLIAFSSNRRAFEGALTDREKAIFANDPSAALDLYVMKSDGSDVRRITDVFGYDGGPFFSPDGKRICWRRFSEDGATAEIYSANVDGTDIQRLTTLGAMSWAPFYHPSGEYLIFTTNLQGFANFELYIVDAAGKQAPQRITSTDGFDGLPVFTPDGKQIAWTSNRSSDKRSQIYIADWNHDAARKAMGLDKSNVLPGNELAEPTPIQLDSVRTAAREAAGATEIDYRAQDVARHVDFLCRPELGGRLTGTQGERLATAYVASYLDSLGLAPGGAKGDFFQEFPFTAGVELAQSNALQSGSTNWKLNEDWRPLVFSKSTQIEPTEVIFAGYGIVAPRDGEQAEYDSYVHLDVENKWVMVLRQMPSDITPERRQHLARYSSLRFKAMAARDRGAKGIIVVSGPNSGVRQQLVPLQVDGSLSGTSIAAISVTDAVAEKWFEKSEDKLLDLQKELDRGEMMMGFALPEVLVSCTIEIQQVKRTGRNALGLLMAGDAPAKSIVIVGAHIDHLGVGSSGSSLALDNEKGGMHRGADDNASGVAAMLEIAQSMVTQKKSGKLKLEHDVLFAAWSGEEMGLLGSAYFSDHFFELYPHMTESGAGKLYPAVIACFNLDMVGRLRDNLVLQGIGSSDLWPKEIEKRNAVVGLPLTLQNDSYLPTDASTFFLDGVPILSAFTGSHSEYHTPRDTPELLNYEGAASTAKLMGLIARSVATQVDAPKYQEQAAPENQGARAVMTAYLGTIPDYAQGDIKGVMLSGVAKDGPASKAGVQGKDIIVELAGRKVENIYDYTYAIEAIKAGQETEILVKRGEQTLRLKVTPQSRQ